MITTLTATAHAHILAASDGQGTWFNNPAIQQDLAKATKDTVLMVLTSSVIAIVIGGLLGILLVHLRTVRGIIPQIIAALLGLVVNLGRSIPFAVLQILALSLARRIVGSGINWQAAGILLAIGGIPYFTRLVESNLAGVDRGKVEAAQMMGASRVWILFGVLVRESIPALINSVTILVVTLIGYSAMVGVIGAGGLGALALNYGYYASKWDAFTIILVVLVLMVQVVQVIGDMLSRLADHR